MYFLTILLFINGFKDNQQSSNNPQGSVIYASYFNTLKINNCIFENNTNSTVACESKGYLKINNSIFRNNNVIQDYGAFGGAIYFY